MGIKRLFHKSVIAIVHFVTQRKQSIPSNAVHLVARVDKLLQIRSFSRKIDKKNINIRI